MQYKIHYRQAVSISKIEPMLVIFYSKNKYDFVLVTFNYVHHTNDEYQKQFKKKLL